MIDIVTCLELFMYRVMIYGDPFGNNSVVQGCPI